MENPQAKTEELIEKLSTFSYSVDSLQVLAWTELRHLNSDKTFISHHKDIIRYQKLTKLEEVGYVLQLVCELNKDQSEEFKRTIKELEESKILLEANSKKLRQQINYTDDLLEEVVKENEELVKELEGKGLSEKDFRKQLKQKQLIETKDDTIDRLQTALENARRELNIIHKSRSPTPSLSEELKGAGVPTITVSGSHQQNIELSEDEAQALELLKEVKTVITNARKAGSRGYTAETKAKKLGDLERVVEKFSELEGINSNLTAEFNSLIPVAQEILERRSPTPGQVENTEVRMPSLSEITKIVNNTVPTFFGTEGPDLSSEVCRFIQGCRMVESELLVQPNADLVQKVIECLKLRLLGSAYSRIAELKFGSVDALCNHIKKLYLRKKTLDQIREQILNCRQSVKESASKFGNRLQILLNEAINAAESEWPEVNSRDTMVKDFKRVAVRSFIKGLRDQALKSRFIDRQTEELESLLEVVENAEDLFGEPLHNLNTITMDVPCGFCNIQGHEWNNCKKRLNTPYCLHCGRYGHEVGPLCKNSPSKQETCGYCKNRGHNFDSCRKRLSSVYCGVCRIRGHKENSFCQQQRNIATQSQWNNRPLVNNVRTPDRRYGNSNNTEGRRNGNNGTTTSNVTPPLCFKCNQLGHFARDCQNNQTPPRKTENYINRHTSNNIQNTGRYQGNSNSCRVQGNNQGNEMRPSYSQ